jgi:hypothetical protein
MLSWLHKANKHNDSNVNHLATNTLSTTSPHLQACASAQSVSVLVTFSTACWPGAVPSMHLQLHITLEAPPG